MEVADQAVVGVGAVIALQGLPMEEAIEAEVMDVAITTTQVQSLLQGLQELTTLDMAISVPMDAPCMAVVELMMNAQ